MKKTLVFTFLALILSLDSLVARTILSSKNQGYVTAEFGKSILDPSNLPDVAKELFELESMPRIPVSWQEGRILIGLTTSDESIKISCQEQYHLKGEKIYHCKFGISVEDKEEDNIRVYTENGYRKAAIKGTEAKRILRSFRKIESQQLITDDRQIKDLTWSFDDEEIDLQLNPLIDPSLKIENLIRRKIGTGDGKASLICDEVDESAFCLLEIQMAELS